MNDKLYYEEQLKQSGLKMTKSRKAVINILIQSSYPIDVEQIYLELKKDKIEINLSTVYRTLETLEDKGLVNKLNIMDNERMLYEYNRFGHNHYLVCVGCKKIVAVHECPLVLYEKELAKKTDFTILGHKLYLYGYCLDCQRKMVK